MLEIYEILDRFELLYPTNSKLSDLRRSYIDRDLSSLFRLLPEKVNGSTEDLRKAVIEQNLHSIFRLINDDDLRKLILEDNIWKLWPLLERHTNTQFTSAFKNFFTNKIEINKDCFSRGQLQSKIWLVDELKKLDIELGTVFLCAGWYATLATMLFESGVKVNKIRSFDIDPTCANVAEIFNKKWFVDKWRFKSITQDIMNIDYTEHTWQCWSNDNNRMSFPITDSPDTIINTSCEHIEKFDQWYGSIPNNKLVIIQANNYHDIDDHVNTYDTIDKFSISAPMTTVLYQGELELPKYKRFMKIGIK